MVSTFTVNLGLEEPARGDQSGIWDVPENANAAILDLVVGGTTTIALNNSNVTLTAAQYQCRHIVLTGALTASCFIIFPTGFRKSYEIENLCTNSTTYLVYLTTAVVGTEFIAAPPGEIVDVSNSGADLRFKNLGRIGEYMDYVGTSYPLWVLGAGYWGVSSAPLWLNCDGTAFSAVTYPILASILGGTTLPDSRGRARAAYNQGTVRLTAAGSGVNGDAILSAGGLEYNTLTAAAIPSISAVNPSVQFLSDSGTLIRNPGGAFVTITASPGNNRGIVSGTQAASQPSISGGLGINSNNTGSGPHTNTQPTYIGGLTLIRAR